MCVYVSVYACVCVYVGGVTANLLGSPHGHREKDSERDSKTETVQKTDKVSEPASLTGSSLSDAHTLSHTHTHTHTRTHTAPLRLNLFYCGPVSAVSSH